MDIHLLLRTFLLVAKLGNITQSAEQLNFTQPAVTGQIRALEEHFGVLLFERVGKKLHITDAGRKLVVHAEKLLAAYDETYTALQAFSDNNTPIKLGTSTTATSYILPPILRDFQNTGINSSVIVETCPYFSTAVKGLLENTFDLALLHGNVNNHHLVQFELFAQKLVWVGQRQLIAQNNNCFDIRLYPFINFKHGSLLRTKYEEVLGHKPLHSTIEYSDAEAIKTAVLNGLGVGLLPYVLVEPYLAGGTLVEFAGIPRLDFNISVVFHKNKVLSPAMRALLTIFAEHASLSRGLAEYLHSL